MLIIGIIAASIIWSALALGKRQEHRALMGVMLVSGAVLLAISLFFLA
jgi:hypothetical protein